MKVGILGIILAAHKLWLEGDPRGVRANLCYADLRNADLWDANLRNANLRNANLRNADLRDADLWNAHGNGSPDMTCLQLNWMVVMTRDFMAIGCHQHPVADWWAFGDDTISKMDREALPWWRVHKPILRALWDAKWGNSGEGL